MFITFCSYLYEEHLHFEFFLFHIADTFQTYCGILEQICENGRVCKNTQREDMMTCKCNVGFRYSTDNRRCEGKTFNILDNDDHNESLKLHG